VTDLKKTDDAAATEVPLDAAAAEIRGRFLGGVQLAQRWGAGIGEYAPGGAQVDAETGEVTEPEKKPEPVEEPPAEVAEAPVEEPKEDPVQAELNRALDRISAYINRVRRT
jgi:hypothetical protein